MNKKIGVICMLLGGMMVIFSLCLALFNTHQSHSAGEAAASVMPQLREEIENSDGSDSIDDIPVSLIDGFDYMGYLTLPSLDLQLPVMSSWDYTRLNFAPCRYYGSAETKDLVIAAHNFTAHFGRISQLNIGDRVIFTDINGTEYDYTVTDIELLPPNAVADMIESGWDLSLYTCNYSGTERITVRCKKQ